MIGFCKQSPGLPYSFYYFRKGEEKEKQWGPFENSCSHWWDVRRSLPIQTLSEESLRWGRPCESAPQNHGSSELERWKWRWGIYAFSHPAECSSLWKAQAPEGKTPALAIRLQPHCRSISLGRAATDTWCWIGAPKDVLWPQTHTCALWMAPPSCPAHGGRAPTCHILLCSPLWPLGLTVV